MTRKIKIATLRWLKPKAFLLLSMCLIGGFTGFASANTYEVISRKDVRISSVITTIKISDDTSFNRKLSHAFESDYDQGNFGIPKKIKFPETKQHIDITAANLSEHGWIASRGLAQTFISSNPRQKVFGEAVIYLRYNTPTTQHLGDVLTDDLINIVTTEGWQLGYQVIQTNSDPSRLNAFIATDTSQITCILVDQNDGQIHSFRAKLVKVGDRI